ncbi:MAG: tRNA preQ1(34) S-adenosylmethionine ribosyltransferase-isomerase QueA [Planctomycetota bacterium]
MRIDELDYDLPAELIATTPADPRDSARLLVVSRRDPSRLEHRTIADLPELLDPGDLVVFNTSKVVPARFEGVRLDTGGRVRGLYLHSDPTDPSRASAMLRSRRFRVGAPIELEDGAGAPTGVVFTLMEPDPSEGGAWWVRAERDSQPVPVLEALDRAGLTPLPPYILAARKARDEADDDEADRTRYQTVYADPAAVGSVAAPTAGLHFTDDLLARLADRGIDRADTVLHVGTGTFKPVETDRLEDHPMHTERCSMGSAGRAIEQTRSAGGRVIAVGTTTVRTLESFAAREGAPEWLETDLLITPGHEWRSVDGLLTNFHLPRSTLIALVASLFEDGAPRLLSLYREAVERRYRFYSYGDAMLILP